MIRQKNGIWKLTDDEMRTVEMVMFNASERYDQMGVNAIAKRAREAEIAIRTAIDMKVTGEIRNIEVL